MQEKSGGLRTSIYIRAPEDDGNFTVRMSTNRYAFLLAKWKVQRLLPGLDRYISSYAENEVSYIPGICRQYLYPDYPDF